MLKVSPPNYMELTSIFNPLNKNIPQKAFNFIFTLIINHIISWKEVPDKIVSNRFPSILDGRERKKK